MTIDEYVRLWLPAAFRFVRTLGEGSNGVVSLVENCAGGKQLVLKILHPDVVGTPYQWLYQGRLEEEGRLLNMISHPNVVALCSHTAGSVIGNDGRVGLLLEYVKGVPFTRLLAFRESSSQSGLHLLTQVAVALDHCHRFNVYHRDVKPSNILISTIRHDWRPPHQHQEVIKLIDFGVARDPARLEPLTHGQPGTPYFMAPESYVAGETSELDLRRVDQWALACVAYQVLCYKLPFSGQSLDEIKSTIMSGSYIRPSAINSTLGPHVDAVFETAFQRNPIDRYPKCVDFMDQLMRVVRNSRLASVRQASLGTTGTF